MTEVIRVYCYKGQNTLGPLKACVKRLRESYSFFTLCHGKYTFKGHLDVSLKLVSLDRRKKRHATKVIHYELND